MSSNYRSVFVSLWPCLMPCRPSARRCLGCQELLFSFFLDVSKSVNVSNPNLNCLSPTSDVLGLPGIVFLGKSLEVLANREKFDELKSPEVLLSFQCGKCALPRIDVISLLG